MSRHVIELDSHTSRSYPSGLRIGDTLYLGTQRIAGSQAADSDIATQTHQVFKTMQRLLQQAGSDMSSLIKLHTYYVYGGVDATDYWERMTEVRLQYLADPGPAATALRVAGVPLAQQLIGIDGIAELGHDRQRLMPAHAWDWSMPTPLSQGWRVGNRIYVGGQISADRQGRSLAADDLRQQVRNTMEYIRHVLLEGGVGWEQVITLKIAFKHAGQDAEARILLEGILGEVNELIPAPGPALSCFGVDLLYEGLLLEIDAIAVLGDREAIRPAGCDTWVSHPHSVPAWKIGRDLYIGALSAPGGASLEAQAEASLDRLGQVLREAGGDYSDMAKLNLFYTSNAAAEADHDCVLQVLDAFLPQPGPVISLLQVPGLPHPGQHFQLDGIAVLDG